MNHSPCVCHCTLMLFLKDYPFYSRSIAGIASSFQELQPEPCCSFLKLFSWFFTVSNSFYFTHILHTSRRTPYTSVIFFCFNHLSCFHFYTFIEALLFFLLHLHPLLLLTKFFLLFGAQARAWKVTDALMKRVCCCNLEKM